LPELSLLHAPIATAPPIAAQASHPRIHRPFCVVSIEYITLPPHCL
jgi:hypothetical protein